MNMKTLIIYYSSGGSTKIMAETLSMHLKADIIVLEAKNKVLKMSEDTESILKIAADRLDEFKIDVANLKNVVKSQMGTLINKVSSIDEAIEDVQNKFANYFIETKNIVESYIRRIL